MSTHPHMQWQGTLWSHLCGRMAGDVPPEDALKQAFLENSPIAPEGRSTGWGGAQMWPPTAPRLGQPPGCHGGWPCMPGCDAPQALQQHQYLFHLWDSASETLMELLACLNIPGVYFGCCCLLRHYRKHYTIFPCLLWVWRRALAQDTHRANIPSSQTGTMVGRGPTEPP